MQSLTGFFSITDQSQKLEVCICSTVTATVLLGLVGSRGSNFCVCTQFTVLYFLLRFFGESFFQELQCPHDELGSLYVVSWPADDLGGYARGYNSTLIACRISQENSTGVYQCLLNRSRDDPMSLWSAVVSIHTPVVETPSLGKG